jgi:predicted NUDIX family NTP pyrophosphohydrolase
MPRIAAGLVLYQLNDGKLNVLLALPGGPYQKKDDTGRWSIPKGEVADKEHLLDCARREFFEETGHKVPDGAELKPLGKIRQAGGKIVYAWAFAGNWDPAQFRSNTYKQEWPPKSGHFERFPEVERAELMPLASALIKIKETQAPLLERLAELLGVKA